MSFIQIFRSKMADDTGKLNTGTKGYAHYLYCLRYNDIFKETVEIEKCPGNETLHSGAGLVYHSNEYCIEVVQTKNITKKASKVCKEKLSRYGDLIQDFFPDMKKLEVLFVSSMNINEPTNGSVTTLRASWWW